MNLDIISQNLNLQKTLENPGSSPTCPAIRGFAGGRGDAAAISEVQK